MTTSVTILNNGPDDIEITVHSYGGHNEQKYTIKPGQFLDGRQHNLYVHSNQHLSIKEVEERAGTPA